MKEIKRCSICGSTTKVCNTKIGLLCSKHYLQYKRYGKIKSRTKYDPNEFVIEKDLIRIFLYNKDGNKVAEAIVNKDDYNLIKEYKWCLDKNGYVKNSKQEYLHRIITRETILYVDHINGNKLDNRKSNLRVCSNADNLKNRVKLPSNNTSGILGVRYRSDRSKWYAEIQVNNKKMCLGSYIDKEDAIRARLEAEIKYFDEYKSKVLNNEID